MQISSLGLSPNAVLTMVLVTTMVVIVVLEWRAGKYQDGKKTKNDWKMLGLSAAGVALVERPAVLAAVYFLAGKLFPGRSGALQAFEHYHLVLCVVGFLAIDELLHGFAHNLTHKRPPSNPLLAKIHAYYREAHRGHHVLGDDGRGEVSVTQSVVAGWGWYLGLPNYWFGILMLYFGMADTWLIGMLIKNLWGMHVHANCTYDLYLLNHPNRFVRKAMYALCHVFTFPNQHHHHHSRSRNSAKNMQNFLALYDWLLWKTLVIENERPAVYGWKQRPDDRRVLYRYFARPLKTKSRTRAVASSAPS